MTAANLQREAELIIEEQQLTATIDGIPTEFGVFQYLALSDTDKGALNELLLASEVLSSLTAHGVLHSTLFDGFTPPFIVDGVADARIKHLQDKQQQI